MSEGALPSKLQRPVDRGRDHVRGGEVKNAIEVVVYGDYLCPYCRRLRFAFRHLPLHEVHPDAQRAAEAVEAAAAQGKFWEMHDALYANGGQFSLDDLSAVAKRVGLDVERFRAELIDGAYTARVERDAEGARAAGIAATPAFIVNGTHHTESFDAGSLVDALTA